MSHFLTLQKALSNLEPGSWVPGKKHTDQGVSQNFNKTIVTISYHYFSDSARPHSIIHGSTERFAYAIILDWGAIEIQDTEHISIYIHVPLGFEFSFANPPLLQDVLRMTI